MPADARKTDLDREEEWRTLALRRLSLLLGERRRTVVALAVTALISGFAEAGTLALIAEVGATFGKTDATSTPAASTCRCRDAARDRAGPGRDPAADADPALRLPARIASEVQAWLRTKLFHAYTGASWEVQSRDREGQLQDTMTSQTMQATGGAVGATGLIINGLNLFALLVTAFLLNIFAAAGILVAGVLLFIAVRPLKKLGVRRARALSLAQVSYASGINEAIRLAEETHVFGVASAQRRRIDALVDESKRLFYATQLSANSSRASSRA